MKLTAGEVDLELVEHARVFHFGTISMTHDDVRRAKTFTVHTAGKMKIGGNASTNIMKS